MAWEAYEDNSSHAGGTRDKRFEQPKPVCRIGRLDEHSPIIALLMGQIARNGAMCMPPSNPPLALTYEKPSGESVPFHMPLARDACDGVGRVLDHYQAAGGDQNSVAINWVLATLPAVGRGSLGLRDLALRRARTKLLEPKKQVILEPDRVLAITNLACVLQAASLRKLEK